MSKKKYLPLFATIFAIALIVAGAGCSSVTKNSTENQNENQKTEFKNRIIVKNQDGEDGKITIQTVIAAKKGWLVIHADENGEPGEVVGFSPVKEGINDNILVNINIEKSKSKLHAMLHIDEGVDGEYEFPGDDSPATSENGQIVNRPFSVALLENEDLENKEEKDTEDTNENSNTDKTNKESTSKTYSIAEDSTVGYTAQKKWLGKPAEAVTGTNPKVSGSFVYKSNEKVLESISAEVDSQSFKTNSGSRDVVIQGLLKGAITIKSTETVKAIGPGPFESTIPMQLTINGVTKTVNFVLTGSIDENNASANGSATINMEDFNVTPPSLLKVYTVDENLIISLNITAN